MSIYHQANPDLVTPLQPLGRTAQGIILPAFFEGNPTQLVSALVLEAAMLNEGITSIQRPYPDALLDCNSFALAIRCADDKGNPYRYLLHSPPEMSGQLLFPTYTGQWVYPNAVFEAWANRDLTEMLLAANLTLYANTLSSRYNTPATMTLEWVASAELAVISQQIFWGTSSAETLNEAGILGLVSTEPGYSPVGLYAFAEGNYKYMAWPDDFTYHPRAGDGFMFNSFPVAMAGSSEGYTQLENGWYYQLVTVTGKPYRVYRTYNKLGGAVTIEVNV